MGQFFSDKLEEGIRLVWMQYNDEKRREGKELIRQAMSDGEADAYCFLGRTYLGVDGLEENRDKAFELFRGSVQAGSACGILTMLQFRKLSSEIIKKITLEDRIKAEAEVLKKAEEGYPICQNMMGMYFFWGGYWLANEKDINKEFDNEDKAIEARMRGASVWFEKALFNGFTHALVNLLDIYQYFEEEEVKVQTALEFAAKCGDPYWRIYCANWLFEHKKFRESLEHFTQLAKHAYFHAWYHVGYQYEKGLGVETDIQKAINAYETGAKEESEICQVRLAKLFLWGTLIPKDEAQAYFWFCKAAEKKDETAKMWKGHCLLYGLGTKQNMEEGTNYLVDALNYNFPGVGQSQKMAEESQFDWDEDMLQLFWDLGDSYEHGLGGMPKRDSNAGYYYSMVADGGWPEAIEKMTHYKKAGLLKRWKRID